MNEPTTERLIPWLKLYAGVLAKRPTLTATEMDMMAGHLTESATHLTALAAENAKLLAQRQQAAEDWAEEDTAIRDAARPFLPAEAVDGTGYRPSAGDVVRALAAELATVRGENDKLRKRKSVDQCAKEFAESLTDDYPARARLHGDAERTA